jgi:hypothetical protein
VNPPSGSRDTGFVYGDPADESVMNALLLQHYHWFQYLDDGALSGNHTIAGTLGVTGLITATTGVTAAANQHVTVSGTGDFKHGDKPLVIPASAGSAPSSSGATLAIGGFRWVAAALGDKVSFPISLPTGKRILSVDIAFTRVGGTLTFDLRKAAVPGGSVASIASTTVNSGTSSTTATLSTVNYDVLSTEQYQLEFTAGATNDDVRAVIVHVGSTP